MKKRFTILLCVLLAIAVLPMLSQPAAAETSGQCGDNAYWSYNASTKTLTVTGSGAMWSIDNQNAFWCDVRDEIESVVIGSGITSVGENAFQFCANLKSVSLPSGLLAIEPGAFYGCEKLASIDIPNTVTRIGYSAFCYCHALKTVTVPGSVSDFDHDVFCSCYGLETVVILDGVVSIGDSAFQTCPSLKTVTLPVSVTSIGYYTFDGCPNLTDVYYGGTSAQRSNIFFDFGNSEIENATWHYKESAFDGKIEWNPSDVQFKGTTPYVVYNGSAFTPRFTVKAKDGSVVDPSTYTYEYRENVNAGTGYVFVTFNSGYTGTARAFFKIYLPATTTTTVENTADGIKLTWSAVDGAAGYVIYRRAWSTTTNGWTDFVRWNNTTALNWVDTNVYAGTRYQYGIKAYFTKRTDPVTGTSIGGNVGDNYNLGVVGPLKTTVRITTRTLKSLKPGNGQTTATWDPSKVFTGYQLKYATNAVFTQNVKSVWVSTPSTASTVIGSLTNGKTYYVCIRSYHDFEGTRYYGQWSNVLSVMPSAQKYRALLVGEVNFNWGNSTETANRNGGDVEHMAAMLKTVTGPNGTAYQVTKKTNLSKTALESAIKNTFYATTDQDVSLFFIATHGDSSDEGQLVLTDGTNYAHFITFKELATMLSKYVKGDIIVILESCGAGSAIYKNGKQIDFDADLLAKQAIEAFAELDQGERPNTGELRKSRYYVLAAAKHHQESWGHEWSPAGNFFTDWLVEGIGTSGTMPADTNKDKVVTLNELYKYIAQYDTYQFYDGYGYYTQQVQVYPENSTYKLFKR